MFLRWLIFGKPTLAEPERAGSFAAKRAEYHDGYVASVNC